MLQPGDTLNHGAYRIERKLGKGGFGLVYLATEIALHRLVAIKTLQPEWAEEEPAITEAFASEARLAARLSHPHIVPIYFVGEEGGVRYLVMEYLPGGDAEVALARGAPPPPKVLRWLHEIALGLACAHGQGIVHRDLKLRNVLLTADGHLKIADFGLAKAMGAQTKTVLRAVATPAYVSPEQLQGRSTDARADLYALGIMAYQLCTGRLPYDAPDIADTTAKLMAISYQHVHAPIPSARAANPVVPPELDRLIQRLMAKTPEARPASAAEVAQALEDLRHPTAPQAIPFTQTMPAGIPETRPAGAATQPAIVPLETVSDAIDLGVGATRTAIRSGPAPPQGRRWSRKWLAVPALLLAVGSGAWAVKASLDAEARRTAEAQREAETRRQAEEARRAEEERQARLREEQRKANEEAVRQREEESRRRAELEGRRAEEEARQRAEAERQRVQQARLREEQQRQEEARQREEAARRAAQDFLRRGGEKMRSGDYRGAIEDATQGIRFDQGIPSLYVMRGAARIRTGDYKEAVAEFDEVLRRWPETAPAVFYRAQAREKLGDTQGALQDYQRAAELGSSQGNSRGRQAALDAINRLQQPPAPDPEELRRKAADTYLRGLGKLQTKDHKGAIEDFTETIRLNPKHPDARYQRSGAYVALADYKAALSDLDETVRLAPENALAVMRRGSVRQKLGDNPGALQDYRKAADLFAAQRNPSMQKTALASASEIEASLQPRRPPKRGAIGSGDARSLADAEQVALNNCRLNGGSSCKVLTRFCTGKPGGPPSYGAIAYSSSARRSGYSQNYGTVAGAQDGAMRQCRENDCKIITSIKNTCAALAVE